MKHNGIIPSDEADKLYSCPILSGDSDTFLNGAGDFDHPHVEYYTADITNSVYWDQSAALCSSSTYWNIRTSAWSYPVFQVDKYGHIVKLSCRRVRINPVAADTAGLMTAADKIKFDEMYAWYSAQKEG